MTAGDEPMQPGMHSSSSQDGFNLRLLFFVAFLMFCLFFSNVKPCRFFNVALQQGVFVMTGHETSVS